MAKRTTKEVNEGLKANGLDKLSKVLDFNAKLALLKMIENPYKTPDVRSGVYLVRAGDTDHYKIGVAKDENERLKGLQSGNPLKLSIVNYYKSDYAYKIEILLHSVCSQFRVRDNGEWFKFKEKDISSFEVFCKMCEDIIRKQEKNRNE
jgi:hypothetical protein